MQLRAMFARIERFGTDWRRILLRGAAGVLIGLSLAAASLFNPDAMVFAAREFSWLPAAGIALLAVGVVECLDAAIARELRDFFLHVQNGVLDLVVGGVIVFGINDDPSRLSLLIAAFLMVRGIFRMILTHAMQLFQRFAALIGGGITLILGFLVWAEWPTSAAWFLAFCLSVEIALRGWALMMFAFWVKARRANS